MDQVLGKCGIARARVRTLEKMEEVEKVDLDVGVSLRMGRRTLSGTPRPARAGGREEKG
jgi:hypothetical protein